MPWMEVTLRKMDENAKQQLLSRLNQEFIDATGFEDEILHIRFSEFEPLTVGTAGHFSDSENFAHVVLYTPRMRFDVKRSVVAGINSALQTVQAKPLIHILEFPYDNIGVEGSLLTDTDDELASRPYYYVLPH